MSDSKDKNRSSKNNNENIENYSNILWNDNSIMSPKIDSDKESFTIMMPPPNVTGSLHIGHALNMTLQDVLTRFWRLNDKNVLWQPGTDHAGIATQMVVERQMADKNEPGRREIGREKFLEKVWDWKKDSGGKILNQLKRLGASADWSRERFTLDEGLSEAVKEVFVSLFEEGLIYRDKRLVNWDTKLQTAISDLEVIQREVKGYYWHFKYPILGSEDFIIIATTRPETMLGDTGIAVNPKDDRYKHLIGKKAVLPIVGREIIVVGDNYADPEKGTGAVKITPAHDFNDFQVGKRHNLKVINILKEDGRLNNNVPEEYQGLSIFQAREMIVKSISDLGLLDKIEDTIHTVPYGDRSNTVIEPFLTDQWFVDAKKLALPAINAVKNKETIFVPKSWENTFFEWMNNIEPWCISRQLWWGHRIPAWHSDKGDIFVAKSEKEAEGQAKDKYGELPYILKQDSDVLDTWFSSGLWPFSTLDWPKKSQYLDKHYPGNTLVTGFDIIFFWVARMMMLGIHFMKKSPFKEVYVHALVRDSDGNKMSKSKGNVVDPLNLMDKYGVDAIRFTLVALATQGRDIKLSEDRIVGYRNFFTKINNVSRYLQLNNCLIDKSIDLNMVKMPINHWILNLFYTCSDNVKKDVLAYRFNEAANKIYHFVWHNYCDWYIEFTKSFISESDETKHIASYIFSKILILLHSIAPFNTEYLYSNVHKYGKVLALEKWPVKDKELLIDKNKLDEVNWLVKLITEIRSLRSILNIPFKSLINIYYKGLNNVYIIYINNNLNTLKQMVRVSNFLKDDFNNKDVAQIIVDQATFYVPLKGLINIEVEYKRLNNDLKKLQNDIDKINNKLNNKKFIERAPKEVIEEQTDRKEKLVSLADRMTIALQKMTTE